MQQYFVKGQVENPVIIRDKDTLKHMFSVMRLVEDDEVVLVFEDGIKRLARVADSERHVLNLVEEGLKTDYLNDSAKRELLQYQASALEKEEKKEEAANIYAEILEDETEPGKREELYKKMVQLYETAGRRDMASDTCIQGIKELGESEELKLTHIRLICADPAVNRDTCALKIKEYVTEDTELLENAEFKKLQKEYGIKAEGGNIWVGR